MEANGLTHPTSHSSRFFELQMLSRLTNYPLILCHDYLKQPVFSHRCGVQRINLGKKHPPWRQRARAGLTDSHHVVPAIQQARAELQPVGRVAYVDESQLPVRVLTDGRCPRHQEPADDEQDDAQQTQHSPAGHIGDPLGGARQEHLQHPVGEGDEKLAFRKTLHNISVD